MKKSAAASPRRTVVVDAGPLKAAIDRGDIDHAVEVALRCIQREKLHQGASAIPTMAPFLTRIYLMLGRLHACADLCREFMDPIRERDNRFVYTAGSMQTDLPNVGGAGVGLGQALDQTRRQVLVEEQFHSGEVETNFRSRSAANARHAAMRRPRMHGLPPRLPGSMVMIFR